MCGGFVLICLIKLYFSVKEFEKVKITDNVYPVRINDLYAKFKV
jgi:hypothetical protein